MSAPIRPEPDNWLVADARGRIQPMQGRQLGPQSPFAPADGAAVRLPSRQPTLPDYLRMARMTAGGVAAGGARIATDLAAIPAMPIQGGVGSLQTVGRGMVRPSPLPSMGSHIRPAIDRALGRGEAMASGLGNFVGGTPSTPSEQDFRDIGGLAGNLVAWERLPALLRGAPGALRGAGDFVRQEAKVVRDYATPFDVSRMQPLQEYQMRQFMGLPISAELEAKIAAQEARAAAQGDLRPLPR